MCTVYTLTVGGESKCSWCMRWGWAKQRIEMWQLVVPPSLMWVFNRYYWLLLISLYLSPSTKFEVVVLNSLLSLDLSSSGLLQSFLLYSMVFTRLWVSHKEGTVHPLSDFSHSAQSLVMNDRCAALCSKMDVWWLVETKTDPYKILISQLGLTRSDSWELNYYMFTVISPKMCVNV